MKKQVTQKQVDEAIKKERKEVFGVLVIITVIYAIFYAFMTLFTLKLDPMNWELTGNGWFRGIFGAISILLIYIGVNSIYVFFDNRKKYKQLLK